MEYIITSGAMQIPIDKVRSLINTSTGKLACNYAQALDEDDNKIIFIHTKTSLLPNDSKRIKKVLINDPEDLLKEIKRNISNQSIVIHLMAVSDFMYKGSITSQTIYDLLYTNLNSIKDADDVKELIENTLQKENKLTSKDNQMLYLEKSIKVVDEIKKIAPECKLISFKLLSKVSEDELIEVAVNQKNRTHSDIVVGNIQENITNQNHRAVIITDEDKIKVDTKEEIVNQTIKLIKEKL